MHLITDSYTEKKCGKCLYCNVSYGSAASIYRVEECVSDELQDTRLVISNDTNHYSHRPENPFSHFPARKYSTILNHFHITSGVYLYLKKSYQEPLNPNKLFRKREGKESFEIRMNSTEEREIVPFIYSSLTPCC